MVNVMLKPCHIQVNKDYVFILLENCFFTVEIDHERYEFVPKKETRVIVNRESGKIENTNAILAFEKENKLVYIAMSELILMPEFLIEIYYIAKPYYKDVSNDTIANETEMVIMEMEQVNVKRLIDYALDEKDEGRFYELVQLLK